MTYSLAGHTSTSDASACNSGNNNGCTPNGWCPMCLSPRESLGVTDSLAPTTRQNQERAQRRVSEGRRTVPSFARVIVWSRSPPLLFPSAGRRIPTHLPGRARRNFGTKRCGDHLTRLWRSSRPEKTFLLLAESTENLFSFSLLHLYPILIEPHQEGLSPQKDSKFVPKVGLLI